MFACRWISLSLVLIPGMIFVLEVHAKAMTTISYGVRSSIMHFIDDPFEWVIQEVLNILRMACW